jgi:hypothetical protein
MFWAVSWLGEVCVSAFDAWVLIAVAQLSREAGIGVVIALYAFSGALGAVGIVFGNLCHSEPPMRLTTDHWPLILFSRSSRDSQFAEPFAGLQGFVGFRIALDHVPKLHHSILLLAQLD